MRAAIELDTATRLDHLVVAVPEMRHWPERIADELAVDLIPGGRHEGLGTRNAVVGLDNGVYLEVLGPDEDQAPFPGPWRIEFAELTRPTLVTYVIEPVSLTERIERIRSAGFDPGTVREMSRQRPDGVLLSWRVVSHRPVNGPGALGGVLPFMIDWGATPRPSETLTPQASLRSLRVEHPDPAAAQSRLRAWGITAPVAAAEAPAVLATLETPNGIVELG